MNITQHLRRVAKLGVLYRSPAQSSLSLSNRLQSISQDISNLLMPSSKGKCAILKIQCSVGKPYEKHASCEMDDNALNCLAFMPRQNNFLSNFKSFDLHCENNALKKEITDPVKRVNIGTPFESSVVKDMGLPSNSQTEVVDPVPWVIPKHAKINMVIIKRRKMNKHQRKKWLKKMKLFLYKREQRKIVNKDKAFREFIHTKMKEAEEFDAKRYVAEQLETANWVAPQTRVRGFLAPEWVVKQDQEKKEYERRLMLRVEKCLTRKK